VSYWTTPECTAVGWLEPVQTKSGKYPYLYSQSQAIHARSLLPCQDTPAIKATYAAKVRSVLPVLLSGLRQSPKPEEKWVPGKEVEYVYDQVSASHLALRLGGIEIRADAHPYQPVAIPSYLIAMASGELVYRPFKQLEGRKWRSGAWTEVSEKASTGSINLIRPRSGIVRSAVTYCTAAHDGRGLLGVQRGHSSVR
jgi:leukotriene-A4 hydrolase